MIWSCVDVFLLMFSIWIFRIVNIYGEYGRYCTFTIQCSTKNIQTTDQEVFRIGTDSNFSFNAFDNTWYKQKYAEKYTTYISLNASKNQAIFKLFFFAYAYKKDKMCVHTHTHFLCF